MAKEDPDQALDAVAGWRRDEATKQRRSDYVRVLYGTDSKQRKEQDTHEWSELRKQVASHTCWSSRFEVLLLFVVLFNVIAMAVETDVELQCTNCDTTHFIVINTILLVVYTLEVSLAVFVQRCDFFWQIWNILDLVIVLQGYS